MAMVRKLLCTIAVASLLMSVAGVHAMRSLGHDNDSVGAAGRVVVPLTPEQQEDINKELIAAIQKNDAQEVVRLIALGAQANYSSGAFGCTPLIVSQGVEVVKVLLAAGADVNARNRMGSTALMFPKDVVAVEALLAAQADVNVQDVSGVTPLMACSRDVDVLRALRAAGADINARDTYGRTPLVYKLSNSDAVRELIKAGALLNVQDEKGNTLLHRALNTSDYFDTVEILIWTGASPHVRNNNYQIAWEEANGTMKAAMQQARSSALTAVLLLRDQELQSEGLWEKVPLVIKGLVSEYVADLFDGRFKGHWDRELDQILEAKKAVKESSVKKEIEKNKAQKPKKRDCAIS